ncbi:hypothetical protein TRFO_28281 [Tritrichomonas foetus]|uniref:DH domain-containing protein n=1 Tax=Tritrichomonas foetus TaxID=1144522 RepID=A0A1J4JYK0_9EUKA|nr:hypothetical protein TRFO_28281 [Tritrichomonas foetus]|eukprot:OHT04239.1 hypothetical protein TRFO_28281 [Tritrichomonas foetus]
MERGYFVFAREDSDNLTYRLNDILKNNNTTQLINFLKSEGKINDNETLAISTPCFRETLSSDCFPIEKYPELILKVKPTKYNRPDFFICIISEEESKMTSYFAECQSQLQEKLPPWKFSLCSIDFVNQPNSNFYNFIKASFPYKISEGTELILKLDGNEVKFMAISSLLTQMKTKRMEIEFTLSDEGINDIKKRINPINELIKTEETYVQCINIIYNMYCITLKGKGINTLDSLKGTIETIFNFQMQFFSQLFSQGKNPYSAVVSNIFLDFSEFFKATNIYLSQYKNLISEISEWKKNPSNSNFLDTITHQIPGGEGKTIDDFIITPVQRFPRYPLILKEIIKVTPKHHPDSIFLQKAKQKLEELNYHNEAVMTIAQEQEKFLQIHARLFEKIDIFKPTRKLIQEILIQIITPGIVFNYAVNGKLYIFDDSLLITSDFSDKEKRELFLQIEEFQYWNSEPDVKSILIPVKTIEYPNGSSFTNKELVIQFSSEDEKTDAVQSIEDTRIKIIRKNDEYKHQFSFYEIPMKGRLPNIYNHDSVFINSNMYSFGGVNNNTYDKSISVYNIFHQTSTKKDSTISRSGHTMATDDNKIFMFGGTDGYKFYNDLYECDLQTLDWIKIDVSNPPEPRAGHSMIFYQSETDKKCKQLVVFGGYNKTKRFNDIAVYDFETNNWIIIEFKNAPSPRYFHSASINGNLMFIHGGKDETIYDDLAIFDVENVEWKNVVIPVDLPPRYGHRSLIQFGLIVFLGGSDGRNIVSPPVIIDTNDEKWELKMYSMTGNIPLSLFRFSLTSTDGSYALIYGGSEAEGKRGSHSVYVLAYPQFMNKMILTKKYDQKISITNLKPKSRSANSMRVERQKTPSYFMGGLGLRVKSFFMKSYYGQSNQDESSNNETTNGNDSPSIVINQDDGFVIIDKFDPYEFAQSIGFDLNHIIEFPKDVIIKKLKYLYEIQQEIKENTIKCNKMIQEIAINLKSLPEMILPMKIVDKETKKIYIVCISNHTSFSDMNALIQNTIGRTPRSITMNDYIFSQQIYLLLIKCASGNNKRHLVIHAF